MSTDIAGHEFEPAPGHVVTVFRSRLAPDHRDAYGALAAEIDGLALRQPGFVDRKTFVADDGERVTVVTFADRASHDAWRDEARHREAQDQGRAALYDSYLIQVGVCDRAHAFVRSP